MLTWLWHLNNACHGVIVQVAASDSDRASEILATSSTHSQSEATRECAQCGETLASDWCVCWRCGSDVEGAPDTAFLSESLRSSPFMEKLASVECLGLLFVLAILCVLMVPPMAIIIAAIVMAELDNEQGPPIILTTQPEDFAARPERHSPEEIGNELCRRGMASAMFGIGWFPPLNLYSIWLLCVSHSMPVDTKGRTWRFGAWAMNIVFVAITIVLLALALATESPLDLWYQALSLSHDSA